MTFKNYYEFLGAFFNSILVYLHDFWILGAPGNPYLWIWISKNTLKIQENRKHFRKYCVCWKRWNLEIRKLWKYVIYEPWKVWKLKRWLFGTGNWNFESLYLWKCEILKIWYFWNCVTLKFWKRKNETFQKKEKRFVVQTFRILIFILCINSIINIL